MKHTLSLLAVATMVAAAPQAGFAQERYRERPPVVVSPDLSAPWVLQLQRTPGAQPRRQVQHGLPGVRVGIAAEPVVRSRHRAPEPPMRDQVQTAAVSSAARDARHQIDPKFLPQMVAYDGPHKPGTIVIDTTQHLLYLVEEGGQARRYGVGTGKPGFEWAGSHKVTRKAEWPDWRPPAEMIAREKKKGRILPVHMKGGPENPLGARALYLGSTLYRIHGTNQPTTIGQAVSSGCIRMRNEDVMDLYERVPVGATVIVI
ncbi:L,D-transpeptidase [Mesorhizobium microcysteis]|uniref:L,D-transpeptidase n=1 Tax=Neoaquamicrobium microcysteis TaxID=2682781 RepID=A0A5D4GV28_9HYPH|nr:L,D-transpeptidase [Mesorhizobium microcysteis]TYR32004.1 L,D-transpeptidase [Mesorhizobium microcysteis]